MNAQSLPYRLILASGSWGRKWLLETHGYTFDVQPSNVDEPTEARLGSFESCFESVADRLCSNVQPGLSRNDPAGWSDWCVRPTGWRMIAHPGPVDCHATGPGAVTVAIGPEGGFTESEVETGDAAGWQRLSLGPRILRVETAALAAAVLFGQGLR